MSKAEKEELLRGFTLEAQRLREVHGAMDDTAPLLWDLSVWLRRAIKEGG